MGVNWFIASYARDTSQITPTRYCIIDDYFDQIISSGGKYAYAEVLGGHAIVKVIANVGVLATIAADPRFLRISATYLAEPLSGLSPAQRTAIRNRLTAMGYSTEEISSRLTNNLSTKTLGDVLRFAASRRLKPRYDEALDQIVLDGAVQVCRAVEDVDNEAK